MSVRQRIVSYETLTAAFTPYLEHVGRRVPSLEGLEGLTDATLPASAISQITAGLQVLEKEKRNPDVMSGTEDRMASLIQTSASRFERPRRSASHFQHPSQCRPGRSLLVMR